MLLQVKLHYVHFKAPSKQRTKAYFYPGILPCGKMGWCGGKSKGKSIGFRFLAFIIFPFVQGKEYRIKTCIFIFAYNTMTRHVMKGKLNNKISLFH